VPHECGVAGLRCEGQDLRPRKRVSDAARARCCAWVVPLLGFLSSLTERVHRAEKRGQETRCFLVSVVRTDDATESKQRALVKSE